MFEVYPPEKVSWRNIYTKQLVIQVNQEFKQKLYRHKKRLQISEPRERFSDLDKLHVRNAHSSAN